MFRVSVNGRAIASSYAVLREMIYNRKCNIINLTVLSARRDQSSQQLRQARAVALSLEGRA